ncbi:hypothetical protein MKZ38_009355 [Zalerion maritima]|uniref:C2H2-type domain-containing protein n=1 Tax=Zalerion maritima TaxID=339359 RepID=A0AAD5RTD0_9PEZI|nr:hypothetical protein MKZ38_009355 [Zalerion maritima]
MAKSETLSGARYNCSLSCGKGFLSISQLNEHLAAQHVYSAKKDVLRRTRGKVIKKVPEEKMNAIRLQIQSNRLQRDYEKLKLISQILNDNDSEDIFYLDHATYKETVNTVVRAPKEKGSSEFLDALHDRVRKDARCTPWADRVSIMKSLYITQHALSLIGRKGRFCHDGKWVDLSTAAAAPSTRGSQKPVAEQECHNGDDEMEEDDTASHVTSTQDTEASWAHHSYQGTQPTDYLNESVAGLQHTLPSQGGHIQQAQSRTTQQAQGVNMAVDPNLLAWDGQAFAIPPLPHWHAFAAEYEQDLLSQENTRLQK